MERKAWNKSWLQQKNTQGNHSSEGRKCFGIFECDLVRQVMNLKTPQRLGEIKRYVAALRLNEARLQLGFYSRINNESPDVQNSGDGDGQKQDRDAPAS